MLTEVQEGGGEIWLMMFLMKEEKGNFGELCAGLVFVFLFQRRKASQIKIKRRSARGHRVGIGTLSLFFPFC